MLCRVCRLCVVFLHRFQALDKVESIGLNCLIIRWIRKQRIYPNLVLVWILAWVLAYVSSREFRENQILLLLLYAGLLSGKSSEYLTW